MTRSGSGQTGSGGAISAPRRRVKPKKPLPLPLPSCTGTPLSSPSLILSTADVPERSSPSKAPVPSRGPTGHSGPPKLRGSRTIIAPQTTANYTLGCACAVPHGLHVQPRLTLPHILVVGTEARAAGTGIWPIAAARLRDSRPSLPPHHGTRQARRPGSSREPSTGSLQTFSTNQERHLVAVRSAPSNLLSLLVTQPGLLVLGPGPAASSPQPATPAPSQGPAVFPNNFRSPATLAGSQLWDPKPRGALVSSSENGGPATEGTLTRRMRSINFFLFFKLISFF